MTSVCYGTQYDLGTDDSIVNVSSPSFTYSIGIDTRTAPATPGTGGLIYMKTDKVLYFKDYDGSETSVLAGGGGITDHDSLTSTGTLTHTQIETNLTDIIASTGTNKTAIDLNTTHRGSNGTDHANVGLNDTHRGSVGTDHTYIDQDLRTSATPTFSSATFTNSVAIRGVQYVWPAADGGANEVLHTDGARTLSWDTDDSGGSYISSISTDTMAASADGYPVLTIRNTDADIAGSHFILELQHTDNGDSGAHFIKCSDDYGGTPVTVFRVDYNGKVTSNDDMQADAFIVDSGGGKAEFGWTSSGNDHAYLAVGVGGAAQSGNIYIVNDDYKQNTYGFSTTPNPKLIIFSGVGAATTLVQNMAFYHDQSNARIDIGTGSDLNINANITSTGTITAGIDDTAQGSLVIYGDSAAEGATLRMYNSVDEDTTEDWWQFSALGDTQFDLGVDGTLDLFKFYNSGNFTANGNIAGNSYASDASVSDAELKYINTLGSNAQDQIDACLTSADINTAAELDAIVADFNIIVSTEVDSFAELNALVSDKTLVNEEDTANFDNAILFLSSVNIDSYIELNDGKELEIGSDKDYCIGYNSGDDTMRIADGADCTSDPIMIIHASSITFTSGMELKLGTTIWNTGNEINGEIIRDDTIDNDSIDWSDMTDLTTDGAVSWGNIAEGELADSTVIGDDIKNDTIDSDDYAANSLDREHLAGDIDPGTDFAICISTPYALGTVATLISSFRNYAITITTISAQIIGGTNVVLMIETRSIAGIESAGADIFTGDITILPNSWIGGTEDGSEFSVGADEALVLVPTSISGAVDRLMIKGRFTVD